MMESGSRESLPEKAAGAILEDHQPRKIGYRVSLGKSATLIQIDRRLGSSTGQESLGFGAIFLEIHR